MICTMYPYVRYHIGVLRVSLAKYTLVSHKKQKYPWALNSFLLYIYAPENKIARHKYTHIKW